MITYRKAGPPDAAAVANLHAQSWRENYRGAFHDSFLDGDLPGERLGVWRERLGHPSGNQFVQLALADAELAGFVCAYGGYDPRWGSFIDNLHVAATFKGNGIGRGLMQEVGIWLASAHPNQGVHLVVLEGNTPAMGFYERIGGRCAEMVGMETPYGAIVPSFRYVWGKPQLLLEAVLQNRPGG